jgi:hypothetical protein
MQMRHGLAAGGTVVDANVAAIGLVAFVQDRLGPA